MFLLFFYMHFLMPFICFSLIFSCIFLLLCTDTAHSLPPFPSPDLGAQPLPERINMTDVKKLQTLYRGHCEVGTPL